MLPPPAGVPAPDLRVVYLDGPGETSPAIPWLWQGYLAPGNLTLLTSQWKAGKTTLVATLLARLATGGTLAGLPVRAGRAVVVSEEAVEHWRARAAALHFGTAVGFICRPFRGRPTPADWEGLIDHLAGIHAERPLDLVVIDPLASFLPGRTENDAATMLAALLPLQRLTTRGMAGLVLHHPRKGESAPGRAARGSGALTGYADILIEMDWVGEPQADDRRRKLMAFSRHPETTRRLAVERTADGTDYVSLGDFTEFEQADGWTVLLMVLEDAYRKLTAAGIRGAWPADYPCPSQPTLWRWLDRAVAEGRVRKGGTGRRSQPFVYWLPAKEEEWASDPFRPPDPADLPPLELTELLRPGRAPLVEDGRWIMTRYMLRRLARAAILRARGVDWIEVAKAVDSRPMVCRRWPAKYPEAWQAFYRQAQQMVFEDLTRQAVWELSRMARSSDPKIRREAAKVLREYGHRLRG